MNIGWLRNLFHWDFLDKDQKKQYLEVVTSQDEKAAMVAARSLAFEMCVQRIAKAVSKCEFRVYQRGKEKKDAWFYAFNVRPNCNETATEFWTKFIHRLYYQDEVLIIRQESKKRGLQLFVADSYTLDETNVMQPQVFSNVQIGQMTMTRTYSMDEVFFFRNHNGQTRRLLDETLGLTLSLMVSAAKSYRRANGTKWALGLQRTMENKDNRDENFLEAQRKKLRTFLDNDDAMWLSTKGTELKQLQTGGTAKDTRDIKALLDDAIELTCKAFLMPTNIMTGQVTDTSKAVDDFLTFCLDSVVELIQDGLNAKRYDMEEYLKGDHIRINTQSIKHIDVLDMATSVDKLLSSGVFCINDIMRILGNEPIQEEWANQHFMTKNYSTIDDLLNALTKEEQKGGKDDEQDEKNGTADGSEPSESDGG